VYITIASENFRNYSTFVENLCIITLSKCCYYNVHIYVSWRILSNGLVQIFRYQIHVPDDPLPVLYILVQSHQHHGHIYVRCGTSSTTS